MRLSLFGAAPDTGNLGVSALCYASIYNIIKHAPDTEITVFDHGRGREVHTLELGAKQKISFHRQGAVNSKRFYRQENLRRMKLLGLVGGMGNIGIKTISNSDAVLDISGGDSFTDLYGLRCFDTITLPKLITIQQKRPLVLLPQTYGPFANSSCEKKASEIVKKARCAWARDARSFEVMKELLGTAFDPGIHKCGVDVAFGLPAIKPYCFSEGMEMFFASDIPKLGINISGLLYNNFEKARKQFGFKADYKKAVIGLVRRFLSETDCLIALLPHVVTPEGHYESDVDACLDVIKKLDGAEVEKRVTIVPTYENPCEVKWVISKFDWFCGTRMHATIAALSSGVPTSAISYSPKTIGVFETCGQGKHVADPKEMNEEELVESLWNSWLCRESACSQFAITLPQVKRQVDEQIKLLFRIAKLDEQ